jgi:hypothetical protein
MLKFNESKICEGIIRHLEMRESKTRSDVHRPDKDNHTPPDRRVEMTFRLGDQLYALEHTGIEPCDRFMEHQNRASELFLPLEAALTTALASMLQPGIVIEMHLPLDGLLGRKMSEVRTIHSALVSWAVSKAPNLKAGKYADYRRGPHIITEQPDRVPFPVSLMLFGIANVPGRFQLKHLVSGSEQERALRLQRACVDKFPKLAIWQRLNNARTILVFEENDIQLTNVVVVADAFLSIARKRHDAPDETYMVSTHAPCWRAWPLLVNGRDYFDLAADNRRVDFEIDRKAPQPALAST